MILKSYGLPICCIDSSCHPSSIVNRFRFLGNVLNKILVIYRSVLSVSTSGQMEIDFEAESDDEELSFELEDEEPTEDTWLVK